MPSPVCTYCYTAFRGQIRYKVRTTDHKKHVFCCKECRDEWLKKKANAKINKQTKKKRKKDISCLEIITVNLPESYLSAIDSLTFGPQALFPSRSELVRHAVHDFLANELENAANFIEFQTGQKQQSKTIEK